MSDGEATQVNSTTNAEPPGTRYSVFTTLLGLGLLAAITWAIFASWNNPEVEGRIRVREAYSLLNEARFTRATTLLEETLLTYAEPEARLALPSAYRSRRDWERAERQARLILDSDRLDIRPAAL